MVVTSKGDRREIRQGRGEPVLDFFSFQTSFLTRCLPRSVIDSKSRKELDEE